MRGAGKFGRWVVLGLIGLGVVLVAIVPRPWSDDATEEADGENARASVTAEYEVATWTTQSDVSDGGVTARRIAEDCDPVTESLRYEELIGQNAHAILVWRGMPEQTADLKIPVKVVGIENGAVGVRFLNVPMLAQFTAAWQRTGHIRPAPDGVYLLDPCSAIIIDWSSEDEAAWDEPHEDEEDERWRGYRNLETDAWKGDRAQPAWPANVTIPSKEELEALQDLEITTEVGSAE